jgi:hypothetical protein
LETSFGILLGPFVIGVCCILLLLKKKASKPKSEKRLVSSPCSIGKHLLLKHE